MESLSQENDLQEDTSATSSSRLGFCEVCNCKEAKYTCPKCELKTCCLNCAKIHKKELDCDGIRDKTKFIPLKKFTNLDLSSDYRLLEEIGRNVQSFKHNPAKKFTRHNTKLPPFLFKLQKASKAKHVNLKFLPRNFDKHKKNTTSLYRMKIWWHIDWIFPSADELLLNHAKVPEDTKLVTILNDIFDQEEGALKERLQFYQAAGITGIKLFMKAEGKLGMKYYELDPLMTLAQNFCGKTIIEYPTILVVLKGHADFYDLVDSDAEDEPVKNAKENGERVINKIIKSAEKQESLNSSLKNLLFINEEDSE